MAQSSVISRQSRDWPLRLWRLMGERGRSLYQCTTVTALASDDALGRRSALPVASPRRESTREPDQGGRRPGRMIRAKSLPDTRPTCGARRFRVRSRPPRAPRANVLRRGQTRTAGPVPPLRRRGRCPRTTDRAQAPFRGLKALLQLSNLDDPNRGLAAVRNNGETQVMALRALGRCPRNKTFEPFNRRRRWRNEPGDLLRRQRTQQRRGVGLTQIAQRHMPAAHWGSVARQSETVADAADGGAITCGCGDGR
jgi:hypothetical protein